MKLLKLLCVFALVFAVSAIAYAETQSVKVSGDITMRTFARNNYDLDNDDLAPVGGGVSTDWATYLLSTAEVQIDADLTDNVAGVIRLVNQRVWGAGAYGDASAELGRPVTPFVDTVGARAVGASVADNFEVALDLAYIELKEFLYSPLTLRIGRQDLWFGKGFIIGNALMDPQASIYPQEYTAIKSFDAVRATLDYDPWTIDAVFAKILEANRRADDDMNLWGVNVGYVFDVYNAEAEAYWWFKQDRQAGTGVAAFGRAAVINGADSNDVHTLGLRGSFDPIEDWTIAGELAYQAGSFVGINAQQERRKRSAWAADASLECRYWQDQFAWRPVAAVEYVFYSGEDNMGNRNVWTDGTYNGWDPMFRGKFDTAIREFQNVFYRTAMASCPSGTNEHQILVTGTVEPTDSLTFTARYAHFWLDEPWATVSQLVPENKKKNVGDEFDLQLTWDYTEDVQFGVLAAWFFPGDHFTSGQDDTATDVVGTVKLSF